MIARVTVDEPLVARLGACNTVVFDADGPRGYNTDWSGFKAAYRHGFGDTPTGAVCMIGAGGVGKAVAFGLIDLGMTDLRLVERDLPKAEALAEALRAAAPGLAVTVTGDAADRRRRRLRPRQLHPGRHGRLRRHAPAARAHGRRRLGLRRGLHPRRHPVPPGRRRRGPARSSPATSSISTRASTRSRSSTASTWTRRSCARPSRSNAPMRNGIATVSLGGTLRDKLTAIAEAGFEGVEIFETDIIAHDGPPAEVGRMVRDLGLELIAFQPFRDFEGMPEARRARTFDRARRKLEMMAELGAPRLGVCSNVSPHALGGIDRAADDLRALGDDRRPLRHRDRLRGAGLGPLPPRLARRLGGGPPHRPPRGQAPPRQLPRPRPRLPGRADGRDPRRPPLLRPARRRAARSTWTSSSSPATSASSPARATSPIATFMEAIAATGYDGWISHEIFNDRFRMASTRRIAADGERSLIAMTGTRPRRPRRCRRNRRSRAPPSSSSPSTRRAPTSSRTLFRAMGFAHAGRHRLQGRRALRPGRDQPRSSTWSRRASPTRTSSPTAPRSPPSACGPATPRAQLARAEALLAPVHRGAVGPGELAIPSIRGVGGALLYFLDHGADLGRVWDVEFEPIEDETTEPPASPRVDHIAQSIPFEELPTWRLFYRAIFDLEPTPQVDVVDPAGLVESQVLQTADRSVRFTLNASQSRQTQSGRFIDELFGAGVQHVAFASTDIFATVERMRAAGVDLLPIPENYYDDLEARFDLDAATPRPPAVPSTSSTTRTTSGRYFQVYTRVFAERFFFEVVERQRLRRLRRPQRPDPPRLPDPPLPRRRHPPRLTPNPRGNRRARHAAARPRGFHTALKPGEQSFFRQQAEKHSRKQCAHLRALYRGNGRVPHPPAPRLRLRTAPWRRRPRGGGGLDAPLRRPPVSRAPSARRPRTTPPAGPAPRR